MRTKFDPEADALYVRFAGVSVVEMEEVRPGIMFDSMRKTASWRSRCWTQSRFRTDWP